jgi:hypothetical protein
MGTERLRKRLGEERRGETNSASQRAGHVAHP